MSIISNTITNSGANRLARQFANASTRQALVKDQTLPVSDNSASPKSDILNSQLTSMMNKLSDAKQAIDKLSNATREISQSRKAYAAEVLRRIKEQMRIMMMLTAGEPKARARQIAAMARDLAAAAHEYAAASGDASQVGEASAAGGAGVNNDTASSVEQANSAATANASEPSASATEATAQSEPNVAQTAPESGAATAEPTPYQPTSTQQVYEQLANKISAYNQQSTVSKEDQEFALEVKKLAAQLRALAKQNEVRPHNRPDQSTERETAETNEALREVEHSVAIIESPGVTAAPSINIVAG